MIRPEEIPAVVMQMALAGERPEQIEALEWTAQAGLEFLKYLSPPQTKSNSIMWKFWPHGLKMDQETAEAFAQWFSELPKHLQDLDQ